VGEGGLAPELLGGSSRSARIPSFATAEGRVNRLLLILLLLGGAFLLAGPRVAASQTGRSTPSHERKEAYDRFMTEVAHFR